MLEVWLPFLSFALLGWSWYHVLQLRERAISHARRLCERHGLQLLDDSVALHRLRANWRQGSLQVMREYRFDTSLDGHDRQGASITLHAGRIVSANLPQREPFDGTAPATPALRYPPPPGSLFGSSPADNVVPIRRARRTLH